MNETGSIDQEACRVAVASVRRHSMDVGSWRHTVIGEVHPALSESLALDPGELPIASAFFSSESWWVITTRRITSHFRGAISSLDPRFGVEAEFGNFKGIKRSEAQDAPATEIATVSSAKVDGQVRFEFETGKASMAPIYGCMFWSRVTRYHHTAAG